MAVANFHGALRAKLLADATTAGLVVARIHNPPAPQGVTLPYLTIQRISQVSIDTIAIFNGVVEERWQIDAYAATIDECEALRIAVFEALHYQHSVTWSGYKVYQCRLENEADDVDATNDGDAQGAYKRSTMDFMIKRNHTAT